VVLPLSSQEVITAGNIDEIRLRYEGEWQYPDNPVSSNVYSRVRNVYAGHWMSLFDYFITVRGGGVCNDLNDQDFPKLYELCAVVSNHCAEIVADWHTYETNEMVRFTTLNAFSYAGYDYMTNLAVNVIGQYATNTNYCSWDTVKFLRNPYGTPLEWYMSRNYDVPCISNALLTVKAKAEGMGDSNTCHSCERDLSGETKTWYLEMKAAGML
jgi:hypothetical protein